MAEDLPNFKVYSKSVAKGFVRFAADIAIKFFNIVILFVGNKLNWKAHKVQQPTTGWTGRLIQRIPGNNINLLLQFVLATTRMD